MTGWKHIFSYTFANNTSYSFDFSKIILWYGLGIIVIYFIAKLDFIQTYPRLFLFSLAGILILPFWQLPEAILDASRYFTQAKFLSLYGPSYFFQQWGKEIFAWSDQFIFSFFYGLIFRIFGEQRIFIQLFNTLLFSGTVVFTYEIGRKLWDAEKGFYGALFLLGIPYIFTQVAVIMVDVPTMFTMTMAMYFFLLALEKSTSHYIILSSLSFFIVVFAKYSTPFMLLGIIFIIFTYLPGGLRNNWLVSVKIAVITAVLAGIVIALKFSVIISQINLLRTFQLTGLQKWGESNISTFFFQIHPFITLLAIYSLFLAYKKKDKKYLILFWFVLFILIFRLKRIRYMLPLFPLYTLMASHAMVIIKDTVQRKYLGLIIVQSSFLIAIFFYFPFLSRISGVNLKKGGEYLNQLPQDSAIIYILKKREYKDNLEVALPILDIYTDKKLIYVEGIKIIPDENLKKSGGHTWNYQMPRYYYEKSIPDNLPVVIISGESGQPLPAEIAVRVKKLKVRKYFFSNTGIYLYTNFITIFSE